MVIDTVAVEYVIPGRRFHVLAAIFFPFDVGLGRLVVAQDFGGQERADVEAYAVVEVGVPADGLLGEWFPAHEYVVGGFAFLGSVPGGLEVPGGGERLRTVDTICTSCFLVANPVAEVGVDESPAFWRRVCGN